MIVDQEAPSMATIHDQRMRLQAGFPQGPFGLVRESVRAAPS